MQELPGHLRMSHMASAMFQARQSGWIRSMRWPDCKNYMRAAGSVPALRSCSAGFPLWQRSGIEFALALPAYGRREAMPG